MPFCSCRPPLPYYLSGVPEYTEYNDKGLVEVCGKDDGEVVGELDEEDALQVDREGAVHFIVSYTLYTG